jgi:hypothetical protein
MVAKFQLQVLQVKYFKLYESYQALKILTAFDSNYELEPELRIHTLQNPGRVKRLF